MAVLDACTPFSYHTNDTITSTHLEPNGPGRPDIVVNSTYTCAQGLSYRKEFCDMVSHDYCSDPRYVNFLVHDFGTPAFKQALGH